MNNRLIIFSTIGFLLASFVFLSVVEMRQNDLSTKNIWTLYFADPKSNSLDFVIDNHSNQTIFHFEVLKDKIKIQSGDFTISNGTTKTIPISISDAANKKIVIDVTSDDGKKEIYKSL